jgi:CBS domain-containing protein
MDFTFSMKADCSRFLEGVMRVCDVMTKRVTAVAPAAYARVVAQKFFEGHYSGLPVVDAERKVIGVVTEFDLIKAIKAGRDLDAIHAQEIMSSPAICVDLNSPIEEAIELLTRNNIIRLPVVKDGRLEGILARCDILKGYIEKWAPQPFIEYEHFMTAERLAA